MEGRGPLRVANVPAEEEFPHFDVHLLCTKLEAAKIEREEQEAASLLRKQVRDAVRRSDERRRSRPSLTILPNDNSSQTSLTRSENTRSPRSPRFSSTYSQNLSWSNVNISIPEHRTIDAAVVSPPADQQQRLYQQQWTSNTNTNAIISRSTSGGSKDTPKDEEQQQSLPQSTPKTPTRRNPFARFRSQSQKPDDPTSPERPDDIAKRRSVSSPTVHTTNTRPSLNTDRRVKEHHSLNYISEYAVCFDTSPTRDYDIENRDPLDPFLIASHGTLKPLPIDRPSWAAPRSDGNNSNNNEGMRSFLNLPSMLKKDRREKENPRYNIDDPPAELLPLPPLPPVAAEEAKDVTQRSRPHTRSNTVPEGLICEAVRRIEEQQRQQQGRKKRRSMGALLQTILLPNHHGVSGATHCVAI